MRALSKHNILSRRGLHLATNNLFVIARASTNELHSEMIDKVASLCKARKSVIVDDVAVAVAVAVAVSMIQINELICG